MVRVSHEVIWRACVEWKLSGKLHNEMEKYAIISYIIINY